MPRNTRNFWIELDIDGRTQTIAGGPISKDGGFDITIRVRENGSISDKKILIKGIAYDNILKVFVDEDLVLQTER